MTKKEFTEQHCKEDCNSIASFVYDLDELLKTELLTFLNDFIDSYTSVYGNVEIDPPDDVMDTHKWVVDEYIKYSKKE